MTDDELRSLLRDTLRDSEVRMSRRFDALSESVWESDARTDGRFEELSQSVRSLETRTDGRFEELSGSIRDSEARTRRHFDVVSESMRADVQALAEGLTLRIDRVEDEVKDLKVVVCDSNALMRSAIASWGRRVEALERGSQSTS